MTRKDFLRTLAGLAGIVLCSTMIAVVVHPAIAARNSAGTMSAANGPYTPQTTISSTLINSRFSDIENELTNSLDRNGRGGFLAAFRTIDGTVAAPAHGFTNEPGTGLYRVGASNPAMSVNGAQVQSWTSTGTTFPGTLGVAVGGALSVGGTLGVTGAATFNNTISQSISGSASATPVAMFEPSLAAGNNLTLYLGSAASANNAGVLSYTSNATPALSTACLNVYGQLSTLCVNGNGLTTIGATTPFTVSSAGVINALNVGGAGGGTAVLAAGAQTVGVTGPTHACVCTDTTAVNPVRCSLSAGILTITGTGTDAIAYLCF